MKYELSRVSLFVGLVL